MSSVEIHEQRVGPLYVRSYLSQGSKPERAVLLLHGYPGHQKNYDLAEHLALNGFFSVVMHYRGVWKSEGSYSLVTIYEDVESVLSWIKKQRFLTSQTSLIGNSWGGFVALEFMRRYPELYAAVLLAPFVQIAKHPQALNKGADFLYSITKPAIKSYSREDIVRDLNIIQKEFNPLPHLKKVSGKKILILQGKKDDICPVAGAEELKSQFYPPARLVLLEEQDHFLNSRETIYEFCTPFLKGEERK